MTTQIHGLVIDDRGELRPAWLDYQPVEMPMTISLPAMSRLRIALARIDASDVIVASAPEIVSTRLRELMCDADNPEASWMRTVVVSRQRARSAS